MSGFQRVCPQRECGRLCGPDALYCIDCGSALVTPQALEEGLARIREATLERQARARAAQSVRVSAANKGRKWRRCPYCGSRCVAETCAGCRDLAALESWLGQL